MTIIPVKISSTYLICHPLEEVQSLELVGLTISHDLSCADCIPKLASKVTDWASAIISNLFLENQSYTKSTKPLSIANKSIRSASINVNCTLTRK